MKDKEKLDRQKDRHKKLPTTSSLPRCPELDQAEARSQILIPTVSHGDRNPNV